MQILNYQSEGKTKKILIQSVPLGMFKIDHQMFINIIEWSCKIALIEINLLTPNIMIL